MDPQSGIAGLRLGWARHEGTHGDFNCLRLPPDARDKEVDYAMLSDICPTGYHGTEMADVGPGDSVVSYGAGPVGLMAARELIHADKAKPSLPVSFSVSFSVSHEMSLGQAPEAYQHFDKREDGWTKVILHP